MPRLWRETIDAHRAEVRDAILDAAYTLADDHGALDVTMSQVAEATGIGRATLYKYFPDVGAIFRAWHERHVDEHLRALLEIADGSGDAAARLRRVLEFYALLRSRRPKTDLAAMLHQSGGHAGAEERLIDVFQRVLDEAVTADAVRGDIPTRELATYCLHALGAASHCTSRAAVQRLVAVTVEACGAPSAG